MSNIKPIQPATDATLAEVKEAALQELLRKEDASLDPVEVLAVTTRLEDAERIAKGLKE